jgi:hypothetical protein
VIWKNIIGYNGDYQINNFGIIRSFKSGKWINLKPFKNGHGYLEVQLYNDGEQKSYRIHQLVAEYFISKRPRGFQINHIDGDKNNNNVKNLEYVTASENVQHSHDIGLKVSEVGEGCGASKLTEKEVLEIREMFETGNYTKKSLSNKFSVVPETITQIVNKVTWKHI